MIPKIRAAAITRVVYLRTIIVTIAIITKKKEDKISMG
jgi:hypothetical protein